MVDADLVGSPSKDDADKLIIRGKTHWVQKKSLKSLMQWTGLESATTLVGWEKSSISAVKVCDP